MSSNTPVVWVMKEQVRRGVVGPEPMDYTPAMKYGEIRFITEFDLPLYQGSTLTAKWWSKVREFVDEYDVNVDFIVPTGQPLAMTMIGYVLGVHAVDPTFLVWRREDNTYMPYKYQQPSRSDQDV